MSYKLYELNDLRDMNRGEIYQDFTDSEEVRKSWWALQPYSVGDGVDAINEDFVNFVESRNDYLIRRPIFHITTLSEEFKKSVKSLPEYLGVAKNKKQFFENLIKLQEYLIEQKAYGDEKLIIFEVDYDVTPWTLEREQSDKIANFISQKFNLGSLNFLGEGGFGFAYRVGDDVLKITSDVSEASASVKIKEIKPQTLVKIHNVWKVVDDEKENAYYAILEDYVEDKPTNKFNQYVDDVIKIIEATGGKYKTFLRPLTRNYDYDEFINSLEIILTGAPELDFSEEYRKEMYNFFVDIANIQRELRSLGITTDDHINQPDNLGYVDGVLTFFDIGGDYKQMRNPPELPKGNIISMEEDGSSLRSTDRSLGRDDFPPYDPIDSSPSIENNLNANRALYDAPDLSEDLEYNHVSDATADEYIISEAPFARVEGRDVFVNPPSVSRLPNDLRAVLDGNGNLYAADDDGWNILHSHLTMELLKRGVITNPSDVANYSSSKNVVGLRRVGNSNYFAMSDDYKQNAQKRYDELYPIIQKGMQKNPQIKIVPMTHLNAKELDLNALKDRFATIMNEDRKKSWIPGSKAVSVKKKCRIGGLGNTSVACNQGDVSNLELTSIKEEVELDSDFVSGWHRYDILNDGQSVGEMEVSNRDRYLILNKILINPEFRGMGFANDAMDLLFKYADANNKMIALTPDNVWGASKEKLKKWYSSLGFVMNRGKNKDYQVRELMIKYPKEQNLNEVTEGGSYLAYHGSDHKIDKFSDEFVGAEEATDQEGPGIYFTTSIEDAQGYGNHIYSVRLSPRKLIDESPHDDITDEELETLIKTNPDWEMTAQNWDEDAETGLQMAISDFREYNESEKELFQQIWIDFFRYNPIEFVRGMVNLGYDGQFIQKEGNRSHIIVYNPSIIKIENVEKIPLSEEYFRRIGKKRGYTQKAINEFIKKNFKEGVGEIKDVNELPFKEDVEKLGGKIYVVGGAVRDQMIGKPSKDLDIVISGIPGEKLQNILSKHGRVSLEGESFSVFKFKPPEGGEDIDIALPRKEKSTGPGHKDFVVVPDHTLPIEKDLERRDITINAIAKDMDGNIIDPFGGVEDIKNGKIKAVSNKSFIEDPLRMLRAVQFAARFGYDIEPETFEMIKNNADEIKRISKERFLIELKKIVEKGGDTRKGAQLLKDTGLFEKIFGFDLKQSTIDRSPFEDVKNIGEFAFLLLRMSPQPDVLFKETLKGDKESQNMIEALEMGMHGAEENPMRNRILAHNMYEISPKSIESKLLPSKLQHAAMELLMGRYPKTTKELAIDGNDLISAGIPPTKERRDKLKSLLINVYADNVRNDRQELLNLLGKKS
jgi:tRNA nucleotidyltransferase/poly(A) polymerase